MGKRTVLETVESNKDRYVELADDIWRTPEVSLHEERSSALLRTLLEEEGFDVEEGVGGMPTAFVASYGEGKPRIGILGEFDALPGLSQSVTSEPDPIESGGAGHGCGHNLFGVAGVAGAIGVKEAIEADELDGTVRFYGCPAEEILVGKVFMAREGAFDDLDAAITWHPSDLTRPQLAESLALNSVQFTFEGTAAHAGASPESGRSALDAVQLMNTGVEYMREHVPDKARVHYSIVDGGDAPNVVPAEATVWYYARAPRRSQVERISAWIEDIAEGAAQMTQTSVRRRFITGCWNFLPNRAITDVVERNLEAVDPPSFTAEEREFATSLQETLSDEQVESTIQSVPESQRESLQGRSLASTPLEGYDEGRIHGGSTEVGDVSWIVPTAQFRATTWALGTPAHSWQAVAASGGFGIKGAVYAGKVLGATAYDLLVDDDVIEAAMNEFTSATSEGGYRSPLPEHIEPPFDLSDAP